MKNSSTAKWESHLKEVLYRHERGSRLGMIAAAWVVARAVKKGLRVGYTTGAWTTGISEDAVDVSEPEQQGMNWTIRVGTPLVSNLHWEMGHYNLFTRRWMRVEKWRMALVESEKSAGRVFAQVYRRRLAAR